MKTGDIILIEADAGDVIAKVRHLCAVADLPNIDAEANLTDGLSTAARDILESGGADTVAAITYHASPDAELAFAALRIQGEWYDLQHQQLKITVLTPDNASQLLGRIQPS